MTLTVGPNLGLLSDGEAGEQHYTELMAQWRGIDALAQLRVLDRDLTAPPGSPANGDTYIVGASATGAWAGHDNKIARYFTIGTGAPGWEFYTPQEGWVACIVDEEVLSMYKAAGWSAGIAI